MFCVPQDLRGYPRNQEKDQDREVLRFWVHTYLRSTGTCVPVAGWGAVIQKLASISPSHRAAGMGMGTHPEHRHPARAPWSPVGTVEESQPAASPGGEGHSACRELPG